MMIQRFFILFLAGFYILCANADDSLEQKSTQLHAVNSSITTLKKTLQLTQAQRQSLLKQLKTTEQSIRFLSIAIKKLNHQMLEKQQQLAEQKQALFLLQEKQDSQKKLLAQELRASYQLGRYDYLQLLLNQQDPGEITRFFAYFHHIHEKRIQTLHEIQQTQQVIEEKQRVFIDQMAQWKQLYQQDQLKKQTLQKNQTQRKVIVTQLGQKIEDQSSKLKEYEENKKALEALVIQLKKAEMIESLAQTQTQKNTKSQSTESAPAAQTAPFIPSAPLSKMQHHLIWPVQGKILNRSTVPVLRDASRYSGVVILAPEDQPVVAVYPGKVVFAHWLKGFGLLIIIDHGKGYMTLYADNQTLYRKQGEIVRAGDLIAHVGHTGTLQQSGLYFEIRYNGKPLNPLQWLSPGVKK